MTGASVPLEAETARVRISPEGAHRLRLYGDVEAGLGIGDRRSDLRPGEDGTGHGLLVNHVHTLIDELLQGTEMAVHGTYIGDQWNKLECDIAR